MTFDFLPNIANLIVLVEFQRKSKKTYDKKMVLVGPQKPPPTRWFFYFTGVVAKQVARAGFKVKCEFVLN